MLLTNIKRLVTMESFGVIEDACVRTSGDRIAWVGARKDLPATQPDEEIIDCGGGTVLPGLVDCHTHLVHGGSREHEFRRRSEGATYQEIARAGGGILSTVQATRAASPEELLDGARLRADECMRRGITTVEIKSGYGLDTVTEEKILRVAQKLSDTHPIDVMTTFLGAHVVPQEYRDKRDVYVRLIMHDMLPRVAVGHLAGFCDVFVEEGAFTEEEARVICRKAASLGMKIRLHVDQFSDGGGATLAAELGAASADHLDYVSEAGIEALADAGVIAVMLPAAALFTNSGRYAPARRLIDRGVRVAVSTDYNPGSSPTTDILLCATLAVAQMGMTVDEALAGVTINAAASLGLDSDIGSIAPGKRADLVCFDAPNEDYLLYRFGTNLARVVIKNGAPVV